MSSRPPAGAAQLNRGALDGARAAPCDYRVPPGSSSSAPLLALRHLAARWLRLFTHSRMVPAVAGIRLRYATRQTRTSPASGFFGATALWSPAILPQRSWRLVEIASSSSLHHRNPS